LPGHGVSGVSQGVNSTGQLTVWPPNFVLKSAPNFVLKSECKMPRLRRSAMAAGPSVAVDGHFGHRRRPWAGTTAALAATQEARRAVGGAILVGPHRGPATRRPWWAAAQLAVEPASGAASLQSTTICSRCDPAGRSVLRRRHRAVPSFAWAQLAIALDGAPHPFYVARLALELALPPLMVVVARRVAAPASA
jgi:hypothetical protein